MARIAAVDGCPGGWLCISSDTELSGLEVHLFHDAAQLLAAFPDVATMAIDMPIGLANAGRRRCDEEARTLLTHRHVCVFNAPIRPALFSPSRLAASAITQRLVDRGVGSTEWSLYPKVINLDLAITPLHQRWCFEVHPEVSFWAWNDCAPMAHDKQSDQGMRDREHLIDATWPDFRREIQRNIQQKGLTREQIRPDDVNDAFAELWTAKRIHEGSATRIPSKPDVDSKGLRMEIWY